MITSYEILKGEDFVTVYAHRHNGVRGMVASVHRDSTLSEIAQEFYEVLAAINSVPIAVREVND